jgi:hypothetical protein
VTTRTLIISALSILIGVAAQAATIPIDSDIAECVIVPFSQEIHGECDHQEGGHLGCTQVLSKNDPGNNWTSPDYPRGGGPAFGFLKACDLPTEEAQRGAVRVTLPPGSEHSFWIVIKQTVFPASAARLFSAPDPMAVPPDPDASSYYIDQWHCDETDGNGPEPHLGSYARQFQWGQRASASELYGFASWDFTQDLDYWAGYNAVVDGLQTLLGDWHNQHQPGTPESVIDAWKKRWAVMHEVYKLKGGPDDPTFASGDARRAWVGVQTSEYYLQRYGYEDTGRLAALGLWTDEPPALDAAVTHWFDLTLWTICGACDPLLLYRDADVATDPTSWGRIKALYHLPRRTIEPAQNGELPPDPFDLPGGTW